MPSHTIEIKDEEETVHFHYKDHEEEPCHYNEVVTLTNKWQYNMSTEQFLRKIPKVRCMSMCYVRIVIHNEQ